MHHNMPKDEQNIVTKFYQNIFKTSQEMRFIVKLNGEKSSFPET